jgi:electron transfer flavoprotein alpha subunit
MSQSKGVLLLAEMRDGRLARISAELATAGLEMAGELGEDLMALIAGSDVAAAAQELADMGVHKVFTAQDPLFAQYEPESYLALAQKACETLQPKAVLMGHTEIGRDLAPRLAFKLDTGFAPNCVEINVDDDAGTIMVSRPAFGGKAHGLFILAGAEPHLITIGPKVFEPAVAGVVGGGSVTALDHGVDPSGFKTRVIERVSDGEEGMRLEDASVVVSGGRGVGSAEGFADLTPLAKALGGCVGASRVPVDNGWAPSKLQVGLTGTVVSPNVYIAVGISGAAQHMAGCSSAKTIIAINRDPEAPIFQRAHFGVVGDWKEIVPALVEQCRSLQ